MNTLDVATLVMEEPFAAIMDEHDVLVTETRAIVHKTNQNGLPGWEGWFVTASPMRFLESDDRFTLSLEDDREGQFIADRADRILAESPHPLYGDDWYLVHFVGHGALE